MDSATWYLGPLGDLRPLVCPEEGVARTVERFGGVHQALSGARTMDVTGHRASYELTFPWLTPAESRFVEALHHRTVSGPFWLLDPLGTNRLPRDAAILLPLGKNVEYSSGGILRNSIAPADVGVPATATEWTSYDLNGYIRLPQVPVLPDETVTFSVWLHSEEEAPARLALDHFPLGAESHATTTFASVTVSPTWTRFSVTATAPEGTVAVRPAVIIDSWYAGVVTLAAAQVEHGPEASAWDLGGAAPEVLIDQVERVSPHYPRNDLAVTLLEA